MTRSPRRFLLAVALSMLAASTQPSAQRTIDDFFREFPDEWMRTGANAAVAMRYFSGEEQDRLDRQLTPMTSEWRQARVSMAKRGVTELRQFDPRQMSESQRVSARVVEWYLQNTIDGASYRDYIFPLEQRNGANVVLVEALTVQHPMRTLRDAENYMARMSQVAPRMKEAIKEAERIASAGLLPPRFIVAATIRQMEQFVAVPAKESVYAQTLSEKAAAAKIPSDRINALTGEAVRVLEAEIYPAWRSAITFLTSVLPQTTDAAGLSRLKGGTAAYEFFLRNMTTTDLTPDQVHEIGLREVRRLEAEMEEILRQMGRRDGTIDQRTTALLKENAYPDTPEGRQEIIADITELIRDAALRAGRLFNRMPKLPVLAEAFPLFRAATAAPSYTVPPADGSRPGLFRIPLRPEWRTRYRLKTVTYHEAVPGHHFQLALEIEDQNLPKFRRLRAFGNMAALPEGWGLYAERLAKEAGWYDRDLLGQLGQLDMELFRAKRLVVDTGLHTKGWTRQQAIDYGIEAAEVDRYVVNPGQACAYMIGELKILELREKAKKALGNLFSLTAFHDAVLSTGTVPLGVLEEQIDRYIAASRN